MDHIDGRFWDCRADNLRFLCPNCHSQTATYAGRNRSRHRMVAARVEGNDDPAVADSPRPLSEQEKIEVLARVDREELTVSDAARLIGCNRNHVYQLRRRLTERGNLAPAERRPRTTDADRDAIVAFALHHPMLGIRKLATELRSRPHDPITVAHGTIARILQQEGLNSQAARIAAISEMLKRQGHRLDSSHDRL